MKSITSDKESLIYLLLGVVISQQKQKLEEGEKQILEISKSIYPQPSLANKQQFKADKDRRTRYLILLGLTSFLFIHSFWKYGILNQAIGFILPPVSAQVPGSISVFEVAQTDNNPLR